MWNNARGNWSMAAGLVLGLAAGYLLFAGGGPAIATGNSDRNGEFVICTGPIVQNFTSHKFGFELEGVWLLDYRTGKLMATAVNRLDGKMMAFNEVDLVKEFEIAPRANAHFVMTTGLIAKGQAALYLAETTSGKFGVYTMAYTDGSITTSEGRQAGLMIKRHDLTNFRHPPKADNEAAAK